MKIAVMGAGAVGGYYGARLAAAGHDVVMIGRPAHVEAMRAHGLRLEMGGTMYAARVDASAEPAAAAGASLVLLCVKSNDTVPAAESLAPHLVPGGLVLSLQNGVDNAARAQAVLPGQRVWPAVVYVATEMAGPGHVRHHGRGELVIGATAHAAAAAPGTDAASVAALLDAAGVPTELSADVAGVLWAKLVLNCAWNALSALARMPYGRLVRHDGVTGVMQDVVAECTAVAAAEGVRLPGDIAAAVRRIAETMPEQYSSTAQDLMRGRRSEIEHLNGYVVRRGTTLGVLTPVNRTLLTLVRLAEAKGEQPAPLA